MKHRIINIFFIVFPIYLFSQSYWEANLTNKAVEHNIKGYKLNLFAFKEKLIRNSEISIPNSDGELITFKVYKSSNFSPELEKKYPNIKSYIGYSKLGELRLSVSPEQIEGLVFKKNGKIVTLKKNGDDSYIVREKEEYSKLKCLEKSSKKTKEDFKIMKTDGKLRTYRIAISTTGEYAQYFGGTKEKVLSAINATLTNANAVLEKELSVHLNLIDNEDKIIFLDPNSDPYSDASAMQNNILLWSNQLQNTLTKLIGEKNYDLGHLFSATGGGGFSGGIGTICVDNSKGMAYSSPYDGKPEGASFDIDFFTHEVGHQLGATHIFSKDEKTGTNVEPGSGSTIMGYAGIVGEPYDVQSHSSPYFNLVNIFQIDSTLKSKSCGKLEELANHPLDINLSKTNYMIPANTPFFLEGSSNYKTNSTTYDWEQMNSSETSDYSLVNPEIASGPLFRNYTPSYTPKRVFPSMENILKGNYSDIFEALPKVERDLKFGFIVRDGQNYGQSSVATVNISVLPSDLGFSVIKPKEFQSVRSGDKLTVEWNVSDTDKAPINVSKVNIYLIDGDKNSENILAESIPNNGITEVKIPEKFKSRRAYIKIQSVGNIFFAVSNPFSIGYKIENICKDYNTTLAFPISIPDGKSFSSKSNGSPVLVPFTVSQEGKITSVSLKLNIDHERTSDLRVSLKSPEDKTITLFDNQCDNQINGEISDNELPLDCKNKDQKNFRPLQSLNELKYTDQKGKWVLSVSDSWGGDVGEIESASLNICTSVYKDIAEDSLEKERVNIFPNPVREKLNINIKDKENEKLNIVIYNLVGEVVKQEKNVRAYNSSISVEDLSKGIYILKIEGSGINKSFKFIKE